MLNFSARLTEHFTRSKSARPGDRELFFSRPKLNLSRLRRPGAVRAQPWVTGLEIVTDMVANAANIFSGLAAKNSGLVGTLVTEFLTNLDLN